jgi:hypothetical protein
LTPANHGHQLSHGLFGDVVTDESAQVRAPHDEAALDNGRYPYTGTTGSPAKVIADAAPYWQIAEYLGAGSCACGGDEGASFGMQVKAELDLHLIGPMSIHAHENLYAGS